MRRLVLFAGTAIVGVAVGLAIALFVVRPSGDSDLAAQTLAKVAKGFVAQRRVPGAGITFFDQPKPYGHWLCRVNAFYVPEKVLTGKLVQKQDWWADDLSEERRFGIWRRPAQGAAGDAERHNACARFRDFDHTFTVRDSGDPERGVFLLDSIITQVRSGNVRLPLSCTIIDQHGHPATCEAGRALRSVRLQSLRQVEAVSEEEIDHGLKHVDRLTLEAEPDSLTFVLLTVTSEQRFGKQSASEGDLKSVDVVVERLH